VAVGWKDEVRWVGEAIRVDEVVCLAVLPVENAGTAATSWKNTHETATRARIFFAACILPSCQVSEPDIQ
jgi:hypothetical protein